MGIPDKQSIFLITGKAGVGKTSFAVACDTTCKHMAFNSSILPFTGGLKEIAIELGWNKKKDERGRTFLIELGKAGRNYDIDIWSNYLYDRIGNYTDFVFVDDWRFVNEYNYFKRIADDPISELNLVLVKIVSPDRESLKGTPLYDDESETGLDNFDESLYNYVIYNDGTLEDLYIKALEVIKDVKKNLKVW